MISKKNKNSLFVHIWVEFVQRLYGVVVVRIENCNFTINLWV